MRDKEHFKMLQTNGVIMHNFTFSKIEDAIKYFRLSITVIYKLK